jgi:uncharacterized protein involved in outer membrane biogenesis
LQTTLLGLAIAIILALVTALVGPLLIDWGSYRTTFETEASRLAGLPVRVTGAIDVRLLPSPQLTLHNVELGSDQNTLRAHSLGVEFALSPLLRGEWRASELHVVGPQMHLVLDAAGRVRAPKVAFGFDPDLITIERLDIQDGTLVLADAASGGSVTLDKVSFKGDARSLLGPYNGDGAAIIGGDRIPFRLSTGRYGDGKLKVRVNIEPANRPLSAEANGVLELGDKPRFEGKLTINRSVAIAARGGGSLSQPWRVSGKLKVTAASALMEDAEFQYGAEDKGLKLTGIANFRFGASPRFDGVVSGRQIDLDRVLGGAGERAAPAAVVSELAQLAGGAFRPVIPIQIGVGIDQITLGGDTVQNLRGDISTSAQGWNLDRFEFRAPGFTRVRVSGRLAVGEKTTTFTGPAEIKANDPKILAAWLEGHPSDAKGEVNPLTLRGDLTLSSDRIAIEHLSAELDRQTISGRFRYEAAAAGHPARVDTALQASELNVDAALSFGNVLLSGSRIERPHDMTIAVDIDHAIIAGLDARKASARLKVDSEGLQVDRLSVADLGGAAFSVSGHIVAAPPSPHGSLQLDFAATDMTPVQVLLSRVAPQAAKAFARGAKAMAPAKLHSVLAIEGVPGAHQIKLTVDGHLGETALAFSAETALDPITFNPGDIKMHGQLTADDGKALVAMFGLDRVVAVTPGPGALTLSAGGPLRGDWRLESKLKAGGLEADATGNAHPFADVPSLDLRAAIVRADAAPLRTADGALPVAITSHIKLGGDDVSFDDIGGTIAGSSVHGKLALTLSTPHRLQGDIEADRIDGVGLVAAAIGMPHQSPEKDAIWNWPSEPFGLGGFGDFAGAVTIKARHVGLLPQLAGRDFRATLTFGKDEFALDNIAAALAGGRMSGQVSFHASSSGGLRTHVKVALADGDAVGLLRTAGPPPVSGRLAFAGELDGVGLSPSALVGSLKGNGKVTLTKAHFANLDPRIFSAVTRAVDHGLPIDPGHVSKYVSRALEGGRLPVKRAVGEFTVSAGQLRMNKFAVDSADLRLSTAGNLDLTDGALDLRLVLSGLTEQDGATPDIFIALKGPVSAPQRSIDVSALTGWLTLRAVDNQTKRLREIERRTPRQLPALQPAPQAAPAQPLPPKSNIELAPKNVPMPPIKNSTATGNEAAAAPRKPQPAKRAPPRPGRAPALPAPVNIRPLPATGTQ